MKTTTLSICAALAAALSVPPAFAQGGGVARLKDVRGNVLVSQQSGLASGSEASRLAEHTRVITTAGAEVIVVYDNGCEVRLRENQRFEIVVDKACAALVAESLFTAPPGAMGTAVAGFLIPVAGLGIASSILGGKPSPAPPPLSPN